MSYEVFGDDDDGQDTDHLIDAGWWPSEQTDDVVQAIKALRAEGIYEGAKMANGISVRFLMRITMLEVAAGLRDTSDPLAVEAHDVLFPATPE